ncbi:regulatory protein RecX [Microbacterium sp. USHLN186]|uniref:regulatory protein RecX n=1 Tax=Microbacterium sp. USHLN186 TaxID=3081286 RepID=UPI00301A645D
MQPDDDGLAPVIPLFGAAGSARSSTDPAATGGPRAGVRFDDAAESDESASEEPDAESLRRGAEEILVRKLRAKQLSLAEARTVLRGTELDRDLVEDVLDEFCRRGYLDDRTLASLLVTSGTERKGQGRVALARSLSQRGIPREIVDEALGELPDDDAERALEFARSKASGMSRLDWDTALRRLHGQLARRGYGGSVAMDAARTALREAGVGRTGVRPASGVRFVDSD